MGGAADARSVDSSGYSTLGGDVGRGFDENAVFSAEIVPKASREMFCDECFGALAGTDSSCVQVQRD